MIDCRQVFSQIKQILPVSLLSSYQDFKRDFYLAETYLRFGPKRFIMRKCTFCYVYNKRPLDLNFSGEPEFKLSK